MNEKYHFVFKDNVLDSKHGTFLFRKAKMRGKKSCLINLRTDKKIFLTPLPGKDGKYTYENSLKRLMKLTLHGREAVIEPLYPSKY